MMTDTPENVTLVPIARIEVLNSRDRNMKVFEEIVESIQLIGLKSPSPWPSGRVKTASPNTCWSAVKGA